MRSFRSYLWLPILSAALVAQTPRLGFDPANLDRSVAPGQDFYTYAVGGWLKRTALPVDKSRYGAFEEVEERNAAILKTLFEELTSRKGLKPGTPEQQVADFYRSGMDERALERRGIAPLLADFKRLEGVTDAKGLARVLADLHDAGLPGPFGFHVGQDAKASTRNLAYLNQGGLGLPDRDYYLKEDARSQAVRARYQEHVADMLRKVGEARPQEAAQAILALETRLARISWSRTELRDPQKRYNLKTLEQLRALAPAFDWEGYFKARGLDVKELCVSQPSFFEGFSTLVAETDPAIWRTYLRWHILRSRASALPKAFEEASFGFYGTFLNGTPQQEPRWKRVKNAVDRSIGHSLGRLYVQKAFSPEAKAQIRELVEHVRAAFRERIEAAAWMKPETKAKAIQKLQAFGVKVGYPDTWKTYDFPIRRDDYYGNLSRAAAWHVAENKAKLGKPIDRTEWGMTPPTVNAYYSPTMNEIVFPAGILQPPFFDPKADPAVNYGAIGWVIAHEMTHGFDDSGSQFDHEGNLTNWWTDEDRRAYTERTDLIVRQFDAYEPLKGEFINGKMTLGENISDLGGLKVAFAAYQRSLGGKPSPVIEGFTGEQRFFIGAAQVWRNHIRDEALSVRLKTDVHSPGKFRVIGPMSNLPEFHRAFGIKDGDPMFRPEALRPVIW